MDTNTAPRHAALAIIMTDTGWLQVLNLELIKSILGPANLVQCHSNIAAQHTGALVDE